MKLGFLAFAGGGGERGHGSTDPVTVWLDALPANYEVFHGVESSAGNFEHLVASYDRGVFVLETDASPGRARICDGHVLFDGEPVASDILAATARKAAWLRRVLAEGCGYGVPVTPMVVLTHATLQDAGWAEGVLVAGLDDLGLALARAHGRASESTRFWNERGCLAAPGKDGGGRERELVAV